MDRFAAMTLFAKVADTGSLTAAARSLGLPLATASRRLSDLESHLGARLVTRTSRRVTLTEAGAEYLRSARRILDDLSAAERLASGEYAEPRGQIVMTTPVIFGRIHVVPVLTEFLTLFRDISVRLILGDRTMHLLDDQIDAALRIGPLADSALVATRLGEVARVTCAAPAYLARRGTPAGPDDLLSHDCVSFDTTTAGEWLFGRGRDAHRIHLSPRLSVTTGEAAIDAAIAGFGITRVLSYQVADALRDGRLTRLLTAWEPDPWPVHLVTQGQGAQPKKLRAFTDFAVPRLRKRLADAMVRG